jgi:hypothetical protein
LSLFLHSSHHECVFGEDTEEAEAQEQSEQGSQEASDNPFSGVPNPFSGPSRKATYVADSVDGLEVICFLETDEEGETDLVVWMINRYERVVILERNINVHIEAEEDPNRNWIPAFGSGYGDGIQALGPRFFRDLRPTRLEHPCMCCMSIRQFSCEANAENIRRILDEWFHIKVSLSANNLHQTDDEGHFVAESVEVEGRLLEKEPEMTFVEEETEESPLQVEALEE